MSKPPLTLIGETPFPEMTTPDFLGLLRRRQIDIRAYQGRLRVSAPPGVIDAWCEAELRRRKAELLELLSRQDAQAGNAPPGNAPPTNPAPSGRIPLTAAQQGIWLIDHFSPGNVAYNIPEAFRFEDTIELETIQRAVDQLILRHKVLRTGFIEQDGELSQSIAETAKAWVKFTDLSALREPESERRCRELIRRESRCSFDLKVAPLARFHLFRLGSQRHVLFINVHHIIADRRSMYLLREELAMLTREVIDGQEAALPQLSMQFAEYAIEAAGRMQSKAMEQQLAYWRDKFAGLPKPIELPHSRARPEKRSSGGATKLVFVDAAARMALNTIGTGENASPFMTFLALFAVSVGLWSQSKGREAVDFCIGSPITHRKDAATDRMIGLFLNMLAFRCVVEPGMSFRDVLRQVRRTALEAYENSDVPFQRLVAALNPDRRSQRSAFFQVMFGYETYLPPVANEFQMDADAGTARYDLSLTLSETASEGLTGVLEYCTDLFAEADIEKLASLGGALGSAVIGDPGRDVFELLATVPLRSAEKPSPRSEDVEPAGPPGASQQSKSKVKAGLLKKMAEILSVLA